MAEGEEIVELEDLAVRPGTYFNPQTEVVVIVDDSASIDQEIFNMEAYEGAEWVRIADEVPVDSDALEATLLDFQTRYHAGTRGAAAANAIEQGDDAYDVDDDDDDVNVEVEDDGEPDSED